MTGYPPDLTGENPKHKVTDMTVVMFRSPQKIEFNTPVFLDSIAITDMDTPPPRPRLLKDEMWSTDEGDIDVTAVSNILVNSPDFDKTLVKSLTFWKTTDGPQTIQLAFQQLFAAPPFFAHTDQECIDFTPELLTDMLCRLNWIERQAKSIARVESDPLSPIPALLEEDPHKKNDDNVQTETHFINVFDGKNIIKPSTGPFFRDSVIVRIPNHCTLEADKDYVVYHTNIPKTKISNNKSGVYEYILVTYGFAGDVDVTTHAYGGEVTPDSFKSLSDAVTSVARFLKDETPLTPGSLPQIPAFKTLDARLTCLEDDVRSLTTTGRPTFGDANPMGALARVFKAQATDTQMHWWSLATLFKVDGSDDIIRADRARYRLRMVESKISVDVILHVDMRLKNPFRLETIGILTDSNTPDQYDEDLPDTLAVIPHFRIVWNDDFSTFPGVVLQLGMIFPSFIETIAIEDFSGTESCWKVVTPDTDPVRPIDTTIPLPDGASIWDTNNSISRQNVALLPHPEGYIVWQGDADISNDSTAVDLTTNLQKSVHHTKIQKVSFVMDVDGDNLYVQGHAMATSDTDVAFVIPSLPLTSDVNVAFQGTLIRANNTVGLSTTPLYTGSFEGSLRLRQVRVHV